MQFLVPRDAGVHSHLFDCDSRPRLTTIIAPNDVFCSVIVRHKNGLMTLQGPHLFITTRLHTSAHVAWWTVFYRGNAVNTKKWWFLWRCLSSNWARLIGNNGGLSGTCVPGCSINSLFWGRLVSSVGGALDPITIFKLRKELKKIALAKHMPLKTNKLCVSNKM